MATGDYNSLPSFSKVPKGRRTERRRQSTLSFSWHSEDEKECALTLVDLSKMTPAEEERSPLSPPEVEKRCQSLPSPYPSPPKQRQELSPISLSSLSQQDKPLPPQPPIRQPSPSVSPAPTQRNQARYVCSQCGKVFSSYQALGSHKASHIRKFPAEYRAAASGAVVTGAADQNKPHACSLCSKSFATGPALGGHMRAHYERKRRQAAAENRPMAGPSSSLTECSTAMGLRIDLNQKAMPEAELAKEEETVRSHPAAAAAAATSPPPRFFTFF
ncbi:zinc finger protein 36-like [Zingiber officinale]|uniref:zinc finger protein 36-like n=1 Tax=Zingiber officinale TaxID=94328 RepID=UPI001C4B7E46|nr:zinc finger protein 36-like [Zingiber officinale]